MEPLEYCNLYVKNPKPEDEGYRAACIEALVEATFGVYSQKSISKWGEQFERCPPAALKILEAAHTINALHMKLEQIYPLLTGLSEHVSKLAPQRQHK